jgi:hypothetical protein
MLIKIMNGLVYFFGTLLALDLMAIFSGFTILAWNNSLGYEIQPVEKIVKALIITVVTIVLPLGITLLFRMYLKDEGDE